MVFKVWLANVKLAADKDTVGAGALAPVPLRLIACGLPPASSVIETEAVRVPEAVGVNFTLNVQLPPAATVLVQVVV